MSELPFELPKYHKAKTKWDWKRRGLKITDEEFQSIYNEYIYSTKCQLCDKQFKSTRDRHMEHNHQTGEYRNIVCCSCNLKKADVKLRDDNTSGYKGIYKEKNMSCKQGFCWVFRAFVNGKLKCIKCNIDKEKLIEFAKNWKKENNYNT